MMWNLDLLDSPHGILVLMDTTTDMGTDTVTGKREVSLNADGGKYFHLNRKVLKRKRVAVIKITATLHHGNTEYFK